MFNVLFSLNMLIMFVILGLMSMVFYWLDLSVILEWMVFSFSTLNIKFMLLFDWVSLLFISFIMLISSMIMLYSMVYMEGDNTLSRFNYLLVFFIMSMILMVISPNLISILLGWDGLGMVSYCLIMYYNNNFSYNSAMVTVLCNRIGDVGILMSISLLMMVGSWELILVEGGMMLIFMMMLAAVTKSAQVPFSVWLPMAMAAPTPVSALVHSSTLVTAGVYLMIRFNKFLMESGMSFVLFFISVITMFMAGVVANFEVDFKKIIALSTLSQLGFMMMILSLGYSMLAFYHLLIHAIFKSMLFMAAGSVIHLMKNNQDIRLLGSLNEILPYTMMSLVISNLSLGGVPFMSGFYSKDLIMEMVYTDSSVNLFMCIMIFISLMLTVMYSVRFIYYLFFNSSMKFYSCVFVGESEMINLSMVFMMLLSISLGSMMNWWFFFDYYEVYIPVCIKLLTLFICFFGVVFSALLIFMSKIFVVFWTYCYCCNDLLFYYYSSMWFLSYIYGWVYSPVIFIGGSVRELDKTWVEFLEVKFVAGFLKKKFDNILYKLYMFMFIFTYFMIYMYLLY